MVPISVLKRSLSSSCFSFLCTLCQSDKIIVHNFHNLILDRLDAHFFTALKRVRVKGLETRVPRESRVGFPRGARETRVTRGFAANDSLIITYLFRLHNFTQTKELLSILSLP